MMLGCTFFVRALGLVGFGPIRFDEEWRVMSLLFEFSDASKRRSKLLLKHRNLCSEGSMLGTELAQFITQRHSPEYTRYLGEV